MRKNRFNIYYDLVYIFDQEVKRTQVNNLLLQVDTAKQVLMIQNVGLSERLESLKMSANEEHQNKTGL